MDIPEESTHDLSLIFRVYISQDPRDGKSLQDIW